VRGLLGAGGSSDQILAIDDAGEELRRGDVEAAAREWAGRLGDVKQLVLLVCDNTCAHLRDYLGLVEAGHAVALVGQGISETALAELVERYRPGAVVWPGHRIETAGRGDQAPVHPDLAVLLSTSGSTGSPKLARFSAAQLAANADAVIDYLDIDASERPLAHLPFHYSFGLSVVHSHIRAGATLLLTRHSLMNGEFWKRMATEECTSFSGVPFHFEMLLKLRFQRKDLPHLKTLTQAGGRLAVHLVEQIADIARDTGRRFFVMYGQTEAGPRISYLPPEMAARKPGSIGRPIPGVGMTLVDPEGEAADAGELVVTSPSVMMGYAESAEDLLKGDEYRGRLVTGDLAARDSDGDFTIVGRKSRFIKLQGNRVNLADVERRLAGRGLTVACVGVDDHLWIVSEEDSEDDVRDAMLEEFTFPARSTSVVRRELPRSEGGKILYRELLSGLQAGALNE
jgi:acyl-CoA synthetase (AMP-forming)/AMP-acid ligase II